MFLFWQQLQRCLVCLFCLMFFLVSEQWKGILIYSLYSKILKLKDKTPKILKDNYMFPLYKHLVPHSHSLYYGVRNEYLFTDCEILLCSTMAWWMHATPTIKKWWGIHWVAFFYLTRNLILKHICSAVTNTTILKSI